MVPPVLSPPFEKGDLGGFSNAPQIPPDPPLRKGGTGTGTLKLLHLAN